MPLEAWAAIGLIAAWCVFTTLKSVAEELAHRMRLQQLNLEAQRMRESINRRLLAAGLPVMPAPSTSTAAGGGEFVQEVDVPLPTSEEAIGQAA